MAFSFKPQCYKMRGSGTTSNPSRSSINLQTNTSNIPHSITMPFLSLPREGVTLELLFAPFQFTVFEPFITGPILYGLLRYPHLLPPHIASYSDSATFILGLKVLFALNVLRKGNNLLSHYALNNFKNDKTWDWEKEIVIVTGGSYGIGELLAQRLAEKSIQVIVLARTAPKKQLRTVFYHL